MVRLFLRSSGKVLLFVQLSTELTSKLAWWRVVPGPGTFQASNQSWVRLWISTSRELTCRTFMLAAGRRYFAGTNRIWTYLPSIIFTKEDPNFGIPFRVLKAPFCKKLLKLCFLSSSENAQNIWDTKLLLSTLICWRTRMLNLISPKLSISQANSSWFLVGPTIRDSISAST